MVHRVGDGRAIVPLLVAHWQVACTAPRHNAIANARQDAATVAAVVSRAYFVQHERLTVDQNAPAQAPGSVPCVFHPEHLEFGPVNLRLYVLRVRPIVVSDPNIT